MKESNEMEIFGWKYFDYSFKALCIGLTIVMIALCCYNYSLDEDMTSVSFRPFYLTENDIYPTVSICITLPYEQYKLDLYGRNVTALNYSAFLSGHFWNADLMEIDYESVVLSPLDYFVGYEVEYRNATRVIRYYNSSLTGKEEYTEILVPTNRISMANMICFGIDVVLEKSIYGLSMKLKTSIFKDGIRPNRTGSLTFNRGVGIVLHYPKQIFRNKWWKTNWPTRNANDSKNYIISYDVGGMEVIRYRNKRAQRCKEGYPDYDDDTFREILTTVGCRPPYTKSQPNLTMCTNAEQLKKIVSLQIQLWEGDDLRHLPCSGVEKLITGITESDEEETKDPYFTIALSIKDLTYKEIRMKKAYTISALVGNIGGFIGLFLGYALMMLPGLVKATILQIRVRNSIEPVTENAAGLTAGDLTEMKQKLYYLSNMISHYEVEMASTRTEMPEYS